MVLYLETITGKWIISLYGCKHTQIWNMPFQKWETFPNSIIRCQESETNPIANLSFNRRDINGNVTNNHIPKIYNSIL